MALMKKVGTTVSLVTQRQHEKEIDMKSAYYTILLLAMAVFMVGSLSAEGESEKRKGKGHRGPKGKAPMMMMDTNKDGSVSREEMLAHFESVDADGDGVLSPEEFKAHRENKMAEMKAGRESFKDMTPEERFAKMDKDGNGSLDKDEFPSKRGFDKIDSDGSGSISLEEMKSMRDKMKSRGGERGEKRESQESPREEPVTF